MNFDFEEAIKKHLRDVIEEETEKEIDKKVKEFEKELKCKKDKYIEEIMKTIRITIEQNNKDILPHYKIEIENIYTLEKENDNERKIN